MLILFSRKYYLTDKMARQDWHITFIFGQYILLLNCVGSAGKEYFLLNYA